MSEVDVTFDPERLADAAIACALNKDCEGLGVLMHDLNAVQMRQLASRLADGAANTLIEWAADSGLGPTQAADIWRRGMLLRAEHTVHEDGDEGEGDDDDFHDAL